MELHKRAQSLRLVEIQIVADVSESRRSAATPTIRPDHCEWKRSSLLYVQLSPTPFRGVCIGKNYCTEFHAAGRWRFPGNYLPVRLGRTIPSAVRCCNVLLVRKLSDRQNAPWWLRCATLLTRDWVSSNGSRCSDRRFTSVQQGISRPGSGIWSSRESSPALMAASS